MKKLMLCCGSGIVTSTHIRNKIETYLDANGYKGKYQITQHKAAEASANSVNFDAIVTTTMLTQKMACPVILGTGLLMNRGVDEIFKQITDILDAE